MSELITDLKTLKEETLKSGLINEKNYNKIVNPKKMIYPA